MWAPETASGGDWGLVVLAECVVGRGRNSPIWCPRSDLRVGRELGDIRQVATDTPIGVSEHAGENPDHVFGTHTLYSEVIDESMRGDTNRIGLLL